MTKNNSWNQCRQNLEELAERSHDSMILLQSAMEKMAALRATIKKL